MTDPIRGRDLRADVEAVLGASGHDPALLDDLRFGDLDSLAVAELVVLVEASLGRRLATEAFDLSTPIRDLLVIALGDGRWHDGGSRS